MGKRQQAFICYQIYALLEQVFEVEEHGTELKQANISLLVEGNDYVNIAVWSFLAAGI